MCVIEGEGVCVYECVCVCYRGRGCVYEGMSVCVIEGEGVCVYEGMSVCVCVCVCFTACSSQILSCHDIRHVFAHHPRRGNTMELLLLYY